MAFSELINISSRMQLYLWILILVLGDSMLQRTFQYITGIGPKQEKKIWTAELNAGTTCCLRRIRQI